MMRILTASLLCTFILLGACKRTETVESEASGLLEKYSVDKKTRVKKGPYQKFETDGTLVETATYVNDALDGVRTIYFASGEPEIVEKYEAGILAGPYLSYYDNNQLEIEGQYHAGVMEGEWHRYYRSGQLMETVQFENNEENGPFIEYHENGKLKAEGQYYHGDNEHGLLKLYDENGDLMRRMECDSGICHTVWLRPDLEKTGDE